MPRAYSVDLRARSLQALTSGLPVAEVARRFGVSRKTLYRWRAQDQTTGSVVPGRSSGRPRRMTPVQERRLIAHLQQQPAATLAERCAAAPVVVSPTTMSRTLRRLGWRRNKRA